MSLSERVDVLRLRNFRNLFLGETVSVLGDGLLPVALIFAVLDLTNSKTDLSLVLASYTIPMVLFSLAGGVWADRLRREWVMIVSDLTRAVMAAIMAVLLISGHAQIWSLIVSGLLFGSAEAFFYPAFGALIPQLVPADRLQEANSLRGISESFGWFVGPAVSGVLIATIGSGSTIALDALTFVISAAFLLTLRVPTLKRTIARQSFMAELHHGWREVRSRTWLWVMMLRTMLVLFITIAPLQVLGPLALREHGRGAPAWGLITGLFSLGMLVGGALALAYRPRHPMIVVVVCGSTAAAPLIALGLNSGLLVLCLVWLLRGVTIGLLVAVWETALQREIAGESLARVTAWDWMTAAGLWPLGLVLAGPAADALGVTTTCWLSAGLGLAFSLWPLAVRDVWRRERGGENATAPPGPQSRVGMSERSVSEPS